VKSWTEVAEEAEAMPNRANPVVIELTNEVVEDEVRGKRARSGDVPTGLAKRG
jgi:hypothetical protein